MKRFSPLRQPHRSSWRRQRRSATDPAAHKGNALFASDARAPDTTAALLLPHRRCATIPPQRVTPARPVVHSSLADAHVHASCLLAERMAAHPPSSLAAYVQLTFDWWKAVQQLVLLPAEAEAIYDLPQYLVECAGVRARGGQTSGSRSRDGDSSQRGTAQMRGGGVTAEEEAALLEQWEEWVWMSAPRTMPTAAAAEDALEQHQQRQEDLNDDNSNNDNEADSLTCTTTRTRNGSASGATMASASSTHAPREVMSFPEITSLLHSYSRYHRGVQWGAGTRPDNNKKSSKVNGRQGQGEDGAAAAAYYRRRYLLHPWHGLSCPEGTPQQMPYVHVLRWMLAGREDKNNRTSPEELWRQHRALESFHHPAQTNGETGVAHSSSSPFRALDVCSQSGFVTDLLLRAGADLVVAADASQHALGSTESTYHEHLREDRSKRRGQMLLTRRADGLPMPERKPRVDDSATAITAQLQRAVKDEEDASRGRVEGTSASAAELRRRRARDEGRGYSGTRAGTSDTETSGNAGGADNADGSPFHVVYIHPPSPTTVWPVTAAHGTVSLHHTAWWRSLLRRAAADGVAPHLILPFVPCTAGLGGHVQRLHNPLTTVSGLRQVVEALRTDVTERSASPLPETTPLRNSDNNSGGDAQLRASLRDRLDGASRGGGVDALLSEEGYVVLVLPRTYDDVNRLLFDFTQQQKQQHGEEEGRQAGPTPSLADWVVAQLDGYYDLVLRRRCFVHGSAAAGGSSAAGAAITPPPSLSSAPQSTRQLDAAEAALAAHPHRLQRFAEVVPDHPDKDGSAGLTKSEDAMKDMNADEAPSFRLSDPARWAQQLIDFYQQEWWQDVIVLKKNPAMVRRCAAARRDGLPLLQHRLSQLRRSKQQHDVAWEDSFEYNEYRPRDTTTALTSTHWTNLMPTYSYLEPDFYDGSSAQKNFLAVGHQPSLLRTASSAGYGVPSLPEEGDAGGDATATRETRDGVSTAAAHASMNFHTLFAQELRTRRRSKLRKLALSPLERQEWYIDEKLIKSSGARVELMNELSKWDLKDYDN